MGKKMVMLVVVVVMVALLEEGRSRAMTFCDMTEDGLQSCKPSVSNPDPVPPSPDCCQALTGANLTCLCSYKNSFVLPSLGIDPDLAMQLPAKCNLTPPEECEGLSVS